VVADTSDDGLARRLAIEAPEVVRRYLVERGSVAVDGVSLTIVALPAPDTVQLALIEYTRRETTLGALRAGDAVHVEADLIARHVRRLLAPYKDL
jgi:riboflavin synthase